MCPPAEYLRLLREREREAGLRGDPETDAFLKAAALQGKRHSVSTEYIIRLLGLDVSSCLYLCLPVTLSAAPLVVACYAMHSLLGLSSFPANRF